ncbi:MAG: hypothetical protein KJO21_08505 [Verrucomicrobiae bacterium]|nr:hypothetical protein [Verrucomicrobiae bacterium]NNJ43514.1 hypothetical protein [Akkermansiaceae bacterium]
MKHLILLSTTALFLFGSTGISSAADSKRTANYILSMPESYEGKTVTLDVAAVRPVKWKSPIPELAFFHATTVDRRSDRFGGVILVAVPKEDSAAFVKKYGLTVENRNDKDTMKGLLIPSGRHRAWVVDQSGILADILKKGNIDLPNDQGKAKWGKRRHPRR